MLLFWKVVVLGQSGCIRAKVVVFGQKRLYLDKVVLFAQSNCVQVKLLYSKNPRIRTPILAVQADLVLI